MLYPPIRGARWFSLMSAKHSDSWFTSSSWVTSNQACGGSKSPLLLLCPLFPQGAFPSKSDVSLTRMGGYSKTSERCKFILVTHSPSLCSSLQVSVMLMLPKGHLVWNRQCGNNQTLSHYTLAVEMGFEARLAYDFPFCSLRPVWSLAFFFFLSLKMRSLMGTSF